MKKFQLFSSIINQNENFFDYLIIISYWNEIITITSAISNQI